MQNGTESLTAAKPAAGKPAAAKGMNLHQINTRKLDDGTFVHEHSYKDDQGKTSPTTHEYSSADINDVKDHMQEHMGATPVNLGQPQGADNSYKAKATPVNLGQDKSRTSMTVVGDESKGLSGIATDETNQ
jgi:hypothetical protein